MGVDVYARCAEQDALDADLMAAGLDENLRRCDILMWKSAFEYCTSHDVDDLQWTEVGVDAVRTFASTCRDVLSVTPVDLEWTHESSKRTVCVYHGLVKLQTYLDVAVKHGAILVVC